MKTLVVRADSASTMVFTFTSLTTYLIFEVSILSGVITFDSDVEAWRVRNTVLLLLILSYCMVVLLLLGLDLHYAVTQNDSNHKTSTTNLRG